MISFTISLVLLVTAVIALFFAKSRLIPIGIVGAAAVFLVFSTLSRVPAGHVGVIDTFGHVGEHSLNPGLHVVASWSSVHHMSVRKEVEHMKGEQAVNCLSADGLKMPIDITVSATLNPEFAPWTYKNLGPGFSYWKRVIIPSVREAVRNAVANYKSQEAYSSKRQELAADMQDLTRKAIAAQLSAYGEIQPFEVTLSLRNVGLPSEIQKAINAKLSAQQQAEAMSFVLEKERQEAERKRIEAQGIQDFQTIVSKGVSEPLLRWKGIEATEKLASSQNTKVIVIGGKDGLPLILNSDAPKKQN